MADPHLHLADLQAVADRYACDHPPCIAKRDQATAAIAEYFAGCGVDLDDPDKDTAASQWEALAWACSGARTTHLGELSPDEASVFRTRMIDVSEGRAVWAESDDPQWLGWTLNYEAGA